MKLITPSLLLKSLYEIHSYYDVTSSIMTSLRYHLLTVTFITTDPRRCYCSGLSTSVSDSHHTSPLVHSVYVYISFIRGDVTSSLDLCDLDPYNSRLHETSCCSGFQLKSPGFPDAVITLQSLHGPCVRVNTGQVGCQLGL